MPFTTGTANTAVDLQVDLNTHLVANGWTKVAGETSQTAASPVSARYWRINIDEPDNFNDFFEVEEVTMHETTGGANIATTGANFTIVGWSTSDGTVLVPTNTTAIRTDDTNNLTGPKIIYDFGSAQAVRKITIKADTGGEAPRRFDIDWSNDLITWTRMWSTEDQGDSSGWANDETRTFTFDTTFLDPEHYSSTFARRKGLATNAKGRSDNGMFVWQGPGYDAARRVYIGCVTDFDLAQTLESWMLFGLTDYDGASTTPYVDSVNFGAYTGTHPHMYMPLGPFDYWIYSNSLRVIVIVKNGLDDYLMCYMGFMKAFAQPDDFPFPLYIAGTHNGAGQVLAVDNAQDSAFFDPGSGLWRDWNGDWNNVQPRANSAQSTMYAFNPNNFIWPWHPGSTGDGTFPVTTNGDNDSFGSHFIDQIVPTAQNELFMWPALVCNTNWGIVGALDGVFMIPRGGILSAEQVITISAQNYRVFTNRDRSAAHAYVAIRED